VAPANQHFSLEEFRARQDATREELAARGLSSVGGEFGDEKIEAVGISLGT
jgi:hypothetical protein